MLTVQTMPVWSRASWWIRKWSAGVLKIAGEEDLVLRMPLGTYTRSEPNPRLQD